jgi:hypothetical protein
MRLIGSGMKSWSSEAEILLLSGRYVHPVHSQSVGTIQSGKLLSRSLLPDRDPTLIDELVRNCFFLRVS